MTIGGVKYTNREKALRAGKVISLVIQDTALPFQQPLLIWVALVFPWSISPLKQV